MIIFLSLKCLTIFSTALVIGYLKPFLLEMVVVGGGIRWLRVCMQLEGCGEPTCVYDRKRGGSNYCHFVAYILIT